MDHSEIDPSYDQKPRYLTRDQEHVVMVSALRQVISNVGSDMTTSSSNWNACEDLQPLDAGPCPLCITTGCYGCVFPQHREVKKEKKHKGVRKRPSGKWSAEIWDPNTKIRRWLGTFSTAERAAQAYNDAAVGLVGSRTARNGTRNGKEDYTTTTVEDG